MDMLIPTEENVQDNDSFNFFKVVVPFISIQIIT